LSKRLNRGETLEEAAEMEKTTIKEAGEIIKALKDSRTIHYYDTLSCAKRVEK
jgi:hypothetical protein